LNPTFKVIFVVFLSVLLGVSPSISHAEDNLDKIHKEKEKKKKEGPNFSNKEIKPTRSHAEEFWRGLSFQEYTASAYLGVATSILTAALLYRKELKNFRDYMAGVNKAYPQVQDALNDTVRYPISNQYMKAQTLLADKADDLAAALAYTQHAKVEGLLAFAQEYQDQGHLGPELLARTKDYLSKIEQGGEAGLKLIERGKNLNLLDVLDDAQKAHQEVINVIKVLCGKVDGAGDSALLFNILGKEKAFAIASKATTEPRELVVAFQNVNNETKNLLSLVKVLSQRDTFRAELMAVTQGMSLADAEAALTRVAAAINASAKSELSWGRYIWNGVKAGGKTFGILFRHGIKAGLVFGVGYFVWYANHSSQKAAAAETSTKDLITLGMQDEGEVDNLTAPYLLLAVVVEEVWEKERKENDDFRPFERQMSVAMDAQNTAGYIEMLHGKIAVAMRNRVFDAVSPKLKFNMTYWITLWTFILEDYATKNEKFAREVPLEDEMQVVNGKPVLKKEGRKSIIMRLAERSHDWHLDRPKQQP